MLGDLVPRYRAFLRQPGVPRLLATALVARMPVGTMSLAMLMHARALTGSLAVAGATVGVYMAGSALAAPVQGRIIDRRGPSLVLRVTGVVSPLVLLVILCGAWLTLPPPALLALAALAGAFMPPVSVVMRTVWRHRFPGDAQRQTAYALDSVLMEFAFTAGPALVAVLLALAGPTAAFAAAWAFTVLALPMYLLSGAPSFWRHEPDAARRLTGPLNEPRLLVVYATTFLLTVALGLIEVGYPGFAIAAGAPALGGVFIAVNSIGSAGGGLAYGGMRFALPVERQLPFLLLLMAVPLAAQAITTSPWLLAALALGAGVAIAPSFTALAMLVTTHAPARYATEAFTWLSTCIVAGIGAGNALGGRIAESHGAAGAFALSAGFALGAGLCAFGVHRRPAKPAASAG